MLVWLLFPILLNRASSINNPAMLAVMKQTMVPAITALNATAVMTERLVGAIADSDPIRIPNELGLAKPHTAKVAIAALRGCVKGKESILTIISSLKSIPSKPVSFQL